MLRDARAEGGGGLAISNRGRLPACLGRGAGVQLGLLRALEGRGTGWGRVFGFGFGFGLVCSADGNGSGGR